MKWVILGGGLTGLTAARLLADRGEDVTVLEAAPTTGGLCRSVEQDGFTFDIGGSHIIFSRDTAVLEFMKGLIGRNRGTRKRLTKIYYKGRYVKYPFENGLFDLPIEDRFFCLNEFVKTLIASEKGELPEPENFRDWIYQTFGRGIAESYMVPYNEKIWNYPAEQMSHHWVDGRVPRPPVEDIIRSAVGIETEGYTHQSVFSYPVDGGIEALTDALALPLRDRIVTCFVVRSVRRTAEGFVVSDGEREVTADRCISTIPLQHLLPCLDTVPPEIGVACRALKYNSLISVCIGFEGTVADYSWLYIPQKDLALFNRVSFPSNYSTNVAPEGCASILAEITYNEGDAVSAMTDSELSAHCIKALHAMNLIPEGAPVRHVSVYRSPFAYVVYDLDYQRNIALVTSFCRSEGIDLLGRFSEFEYLNMDGCVRRAMDFMDRLPGKA